MKAISQREARRMKREIANLKAELAERRTEQADIVKTANEWKATVDRLLKTQEALEQRVKRGLLLGNGKRIAEWMNAPEEVRAAIAVATHLGKTVVFSRKSVSRYLNTPAILPEQVEFISVDAYDKEAA